MVQQDIFGQKSTQIYIKIQHKLFTIKQPDGKKLPFNHSSELTILPELNKKARESHVYNNFDILINISSKVM